MNTVGWFEIYVADMERAKNFYENVLQKKTEPIPAGKPGLEMHAWTGDMTAYGAAGALAKMDGVKPGQNSVMVYFSCEDCAQEESRVEKFGGTVAQSKFSIGEHGFISIIIDTEGNTIGLHSVK
ncbi:MAG: VOC family protein [Pseudomonadota bacterium]